MTGIVITRGADRSNMNYREPGAKRKSRSCSVWVEVRNHNSPGSSQAQSSSSIFFLTHFRPVLCSPSVDTSSLVTTHSVNCSITSRPTVRTRRQGRRQGQSPSHQPIGIYSENLSLAHDEQADPLLADDIPRDLLASGFWVLIPSSSPAVSPSSSVLLTGDDSNDSKMLQQSQLDGYPVSLARVRKSAIGQRVLK